MGPREDDEDAQAFVAGEPVIGSGRARRPPCPRSPRPSRLRPRAHRVRRARRRPRRRRAAAAGRAPARRARRHRSRARVTCGRPRSRRLIPPAAAGSVSMSSASIATSLLLGAGEVSAVAVPRPGRRREREALRGCGRSHEYASSARRGGPATRSFHAAAASQMPSPPISRSAASRLSASNTNTASSSVRKTWCRSRPTSSGIERRALSRAAARLARSRPRATAARQRRGS